MSCNEWLLIFFGLLVTVSIFPLFNLDFTNSLREVLFFGCLGLFQHIFLKEPFTWLLIHNRQAVELPKESLTALIVLVLKKNVEFTSLCLSDLFGQWHVGLKKAVQHNSALFNMHIWTVSHDFLENSGENFLCFRSSLEKQSKS